MQNHERSVAQRSERDRARRNRYQGLLTQESVEAARQRDIQEAVQHERQERRRQQEVFQRSNENREAVEEDEQEEDSEDIFDTDMSDSEVEAEVGNVDNDEDLFDAELSDREEEVANIADVAVVDISVGIAHGSGLYRLRSFFLCFDFCERKYPFVFIFFSKVLTLFRI